MFFSPFSMRLPHFGKRELILVLFVRLFDLHLFGFVCFLFLLVSGKGCGLWLVHFLDFSLTFSTVPTLSTWTTEHNETLIRTKRAQKCFVCFLFLLVSGKGCGLLWLLHFLDFSLTFSAVPTLSTGTTEHNETLIRTKRAQMAIRVH